MTAILLGSGNASASLIFGGYDTSRFNLKTTISFLSKVAMLFSDSYPSVNLTSISIPTSPIFQWRNQTGRPTVIKIDPAIPQIWLPLDACEIFERAFHLTWNDTAKMYLVNSTLHTKL